MSLSEKDAEVLWHPYTQAKLERFPIAIKEAKGAVLYGYDGKKYIDAVSSWWVNLHGHCHPEIAETISETLKTLDQVIFAGFTHEPAVRLAENLLGMTRMESGKVFFSDNGSTAVEAALKMAFQFWHNQGKRKRKIVALKGAYHGDTFGSMSVSERGVFNKPYEDNLFDVSYLSVPGQGDSISELRDAIKSEDLAAFIFEPLIQGASGMNIYPAKLLSDLLAECKENEIITIADEVFTGFGRTGRTFAVDYLKTRPDIICVSKGITGGVFPLGATICENKIFEAFISDERQKMFLHGHSYTGNSLSCAAANKSIEILSRAETQNRIEIISKAHLEFMESLTSHPNASNPRVLGTILALEVKDGGGYLNSIRDKLYNFYIENGVLLRPLGNTVYVVPPYCIENSELEKVYETIFNSLDL